MTAKPALRLDNVLIVVEDLAAVSAFFMALGLELEGQTDVESPAGIATTSETNNLSKGCRITSIQLVIGSTKF